MLVIAVAGCAMHVDTAVPSDRALGWICQRRPAEDPRLWVNLVLDAEGRTVSRSVGWRFQRSEGPQVASTNLFWTVPEAGPWHEGLDRAEFEFASTDRLSGPTHATLEFDGVTAVRDRVLDRKAARRVRSAQAWSATLRLDASPSSSAVLHAARIARVLLVGEDGRRASSIMVRLPDWPRTDRVVARELVELDRDASDFANRCERETGPEVDPIGVR